MLVTQVITIGKTNRNGYKNRIKANLSLTAWKEGKVHWAVPSIFYASISVTA